MTMKHLEGILEVTEAVKQNIRLSAVFINLGRVEEGVDMLVQALALLEDMTNIVNLEIHKQSNTIN